MNARMRGRRITWREGGGASDVAVEAGGGIKRRCGCSDRPAVLLCFFFLIFFPLTTFPFLFLCFRLLLLPPLFYLSLFFFFRMFFFFLLSPSFYLFLSLSSVFRFFLFPLCPPLPSAVLAAIYRAK